MKKTPIAFALPGRLTDKTGGTIYDRYLIHALRDLGHQVEVIELSGDYPHPDAPSCRSAIAKFENVPPDALLIVDGLALGALPNDELRRVAAPIVAMLHHPLGLEPGLSASQAKTLIDSERAALSKAIYVLVPSLHVKQTVKNLFQIDDARITVARPGILRETLSEPDNQLRRTDPPLILSVGLLHPRKGHDVFIKALSQIEDLAWQVRIIGREHDLNEAARLRNLVTQADLDSRIHLVGELSAEELKKDYARATFFALATRYEGHGLVFDEALVHGLPIVSCRAGAVPDTVPEEAGLLVPPDDPNTFADALRHMLSQPDAYARFSEAARAAGQALPAWSETAQTVSTVLNQVPLTSAGPR